MDNHILTTDDVSIKTLTIEVKVMKIGNRQVSLAVFRQLPEERIIDDEDGEIYGIPWGRVNYHVGCERLRYDHLHIVWQKGNELRRTIVADWLYRYGTIPEYIYNRQMELPREQRNALEKEWHRSYLQLLRLDQLFIAV